MLHEIRSFRELTVKNTSILKFSHEGNLLACVSGRAIFIYSAYSLQLLETLRGHKGPISSISWGPNDLTLASCSMDGIFYEWPVKDWVKDKEELSKGTEFMSITYW